MNEQNTLFTNAELPSSYLSAEDGVYLSDLQHRISKLRELHNEMANKSSPRNWIKSVIDFG